MENPNNVVNPKSLQMFGSLIITWGHLERGVDETIDAIYEIQGSENSPVRSIALSRRIKFIKKFFSTNKAWNEILGNTVNELADQIIVLSDLRNAICHGVVLGTNNPDEYEIIKRDPDPNSKSQILYKVSHDQLENYGKLMFETTLFANGLAELVRGDFGSDNSANQLLSEIFG